MVGLLGFFWLMGKCEGKKRIKWCHVLGFCYYLVGLYGNNVFFPYHVFEVPNRELGLIYCLRALKFNI